MTALRDKRRARRVASDEAHAWARSLQLGNSSAKDVLKTLALYVDGDGKCFVGLDQLAADTDLSVDTVRRRLVWLEEIGAISRQRQWFDGRQRNGEGRGKQTSDLITLLIESDADEIEARAAGRAVENETKSTAFSPSRVLGLNPGQGSLSPRPALATVQGANPSNLEPESPLKSPQGDGRGAVASEGSEPEEFAEAWSGYPGHEAMGHLRHVAVDEMRKLSPDDRGWCKRAVPLYAKALAKAGRTKPPNFHLWIRSHAFREFPDARHPPSPAKAAAGQPERRFVSGAELDGYIVAVRMAEQREPVIHHDGELGRGYHTFSVYQGDLLMMAEFVGDKAAAWDVVEQGTPQCAAWRKRLELWLGRPVKCDKVWLEPHDPMVHDLTSGHPDFRLRKCTIGLRVPAPWPPLRGGGWPKDGNGGEA